MTTRIYAVTTNGTTRLVRAGSSAAARNHVARDTIDAVVASQDTLVDALARSTVVEVAGEKPAGGTP